MPISTMNLVTAGDRIALTPPASARSTSPRWSAAPASCTAASDDAQVMSSGIAGPMSPSAKEIRPAATLPAVPRYAMSAPLLAIRSRYSQPLIPTYTPVRLPRSPSGSIPASSSARQLVSSSIRCCGSMVLASIGRMPKNRASNSSIPATNPPHRYAALSESGSSPSAGRAPVSGLPVVTASTPATSPSQNAASPGAPGNRQAMPTIAIPSVSATRSSGRGAGIRRSDTGRSRCPICAAPAAGGSSAPISPSSPARKCARAAVSG